MWQTWRQEAWAQASQRSGWRSKAEERARAGEPGRSGGPGTGGSEDQRLPGLVPRWQGPRRSPASAPLPRLTIRRVWPEGDLDLKLPVGVLDGGQRQEGVGGLREVGHHTLCGQKAQFQTTLPRAGAGCGRSPGGGGGCVVSPGTCNWAKALTLPWRLVAVQTYVPASWGWTEGSSSMWFSRRLSGGRFPSSCRHTSTVTPAAAGTSVGPAPHPQPGAPPSDPERGLCAKPEGPGDSDTQKTWSQPLRHTCRPPAQQLPCSR